MPGGNSSFEIELPGGQIRCRHLEVGVRLRIPVKLSAVLTTLALACCLQAGTLVGHVRDMNWFAQYAGGPYGVGYYEFAVNANATNNAALGAFTATDILALSPTRAFPLAVTRFHHGTFGGGPRLPSMLRSQRMATALMSISG